MHFSVKHLLYIPLFALALSARGAAPAAAPTSPAPDPHEDEVVKLEAFVVTPNPLGRLQAEVIQATSVLSGRELSLRQQATLGETLAVEPGVSSTYFGPGSSRPVIRGLGGDRIRILDNGIGTIDASNVSPDHAVSIEPLLVERIEVVRGPATLLYGSAAIGGAVNVIDNRIPIEPPGYPFSAEIEVRADTAADERAGSAAFSGSGANWAWAITGMKRRTDDVDIPGFTESDRLRALEAAEHEGEEHIFGFLPNSSVETESGSLGVSRFWERGYLGLGVSGLNNQYGVPGHQHEGEEPEGEEPAGEHEPVRVDLEQRRVDLKAGLTRPFEAVKEIRVRLGAADYEHREMEGSEVGTLFLTDGYEGRVEVLHQPIASWEGAVGIQLQQTDLEAIGEEAFVPPSTTTARALFAFEELKRGPWIFQVGARLERQEVEARGAVNAARDFTGTSGSAGAIWSPGEDFSISFSAAHSERLPTAQELFAEGPHTGTGAFERGNAELSAEESLGLELNLRKRTGFVTGEISFFRNEFDNFIFEEYTGAEEDGLPVLQFVSRQAEFYGAELEAIFHLHSNETHELEWRVFSDFVRATEEISGQPLPRIPPRRYGTGLSWKSEALYLNLNLLHAAGQDRVSANELPTDSHTLLSAGLDYHVERGRWHWDFFVRATNLLDQDARAHTSFLKEIAPLPGRNITAGVRMGF